MYAVVSLYSLWVIRFRCSVWWKCLMILQVSRSKIFRREGADVHSDVTISLTQAILGGTIRIPGIYGDILLSVSRIAVRLKQLGALFLSLYLPSPFPYLLFLFSIPYTSRHGRRPWNCRNPWKAKFNHHTPSPEGKTKLGVGLGSKEIWNHSPRFADCALNRAQDLKTRNGKTFGTCTETVQRRF